MSRNRRSTIQAWLDNLPILGKMKPGNGTNMDVLVSQLPWFTLLRVTMPRKRFLLIGVILTLVMWKLILLPFPRAVSVSHSFSRTRLHS